VVVAPGIIVVELVSRNVSTGEVTWRWSVAVFDNGSFVLTISFLLQTVGGRQHCCVMLQNI